MGVKEIAIPALATVGGTGAGAGGAYAAGSYLGDVGDGGVSSSEKADSATTDKAESTSPTPKKSESFTTSKCFDTITSKEGDDKWLLNLSSAAALVDDDVKLDKIEKPHQGCLVMTLTKSDEDQKVTGANFELVVLENESESTTSKGAVIWSSLTKGGSGFSLVSRLLYLNKETSGKWKAIKGLKFESAMVGDDIKISGFGKEEKSLSDFCKDENGDCSSSDLLKDIVGKQYTWKVPATDPKNQSIFDYVKITQGSKYALFFGRDFSSTNDIKADIKAVYKKEQGWQMLSSESTNTTSVTAPLLKADVKGKWELNTES